MKTKSVPVRLTDIIVDESLVTRDLHPDWVRRLEEASNEGGKIPSILVAKWGDKYLLIDGRHRFEMWKRKADGNLDMSITVQQLDETKDFADLFMIAVDANLRNARPYTDIERGRIVSVLVDRYGWSRKAARKHVGMSEATDIRIGNMTRTDSTSSKSTRKNPVKEEKPIEPVVKKPVEPAATPVKPSEAPCVRALSMALFHVRDAASTCGLEDIEPDLRDLEEILVHLINTVRSLSND